MKRNLFPIGFSLLLAGTSLQASGPPRSDSSNAWRWMVQGAVVKQIDADLDQGGQVGVERYFASMRGARQISPRWRLAIELGYGEDRYAFSGNSGFAAMDPWGVASELRLSLPMRYVASDDWTLLAIPSLRFHAEEGASLGDGQTQGLLAGAIYRVNDALSIGPGFGVFSEIEDDASFFPVLLIDWRLADDLSLQTGGGFAASRGPGLQLTWTGLPRWELALGARYEKTRFRLDDSGVAPDGVAQEKAFPLYAAAEFALSQDVKLSLIGGAEVGAELRLEDDAGRLVSESGVDTAPFFGIVLEAKF